MKIFDYEEVVMNWDSFTYPIAVGTPVSIDGVLADNASAHGLIARTVFAKPDADETLKVMTGGIIDMEEIVAGYGQELSSAAVNALCGIHFYKNGVCIPSGGSGGGGVTPEIMAQIENAQWKTETSERLFSETVTTADGDDGFISAVLSYPDLITTDVLTVIFDGKTYTCPKNSTFGGDAYGGFGSEGPDYSKFPFLIFSSRIDADTIANIIYTETAGEHTISVAVANIITTDTFKAAVRSLAGAIEVQGFQNADLVSISATNPVSLPTVKTLQFLQDGTITPSTFTGSITLKAFFYRTNVNTFVCDNMVYRPDSDKTTCTIRTKTESSENGFIVTAPITFEIPSDATIKYYSLNISHN